jgi:hypothetical protein
MPVLPPDAPPALEVFYSPSCLPCRLELPVVAEIAKRDGTQVRIVILDEEDKARAELRAASPQLDDRAVTAGDPSPNAVLRAAGNSRGILPYARSVAPGGETCAKWEGRLTLTRARSLMASCARFMTSRSRPRS